MKSIHLEQQRLVKCGLRVASIVMLLVGECLDLNEITNVSQCNSKIFDAHEVEFLREDRLIFQGFGDCR